MKAAIDELVKRLEGLVPTTGFVLGSGLGSLVDMVENKITIPFEDLAGFPQSGVSGHAGSIVAGHLGSKPVLLLSGRVHYYEEGKADAMRFPIEVMRGIGVKRLILTNAAGSVQQSIPPGSVMMLRDHINFSGSNPLFGEPSDERFVGLTNAYDKTMMDAAQSAAQATGTELHQGVYMWFSGPSFETPAEINMARIIGADAVGMSTVPEVILARFFDMNVCAFSVITNYAAGMTGDELSHTETKDMAPKGGEKLGRILRLMVEAL